jgi:Protein of unknown function (DUF3309)
VTIRRPLGELDLSTSSGFSHTQFFISSLVKAHWVRFFSGRLANGQLVFHFHIETWYLSFKGGRMGTILLIILILLLVGALPTWPYSSGWGYYPSGGLGLVLLILIILLLMGRI